MKEQSNLFEEFPPISHEEWMAKVERDLKGKPLSDLQWQLDDDIVIEPFYHPDNALPARPPLTAGKATNDWAAGEYIDVTDVKAANQQALEGLAGGIEAPLFRLQQAAQADQLEALLQDIELTYISVHFGEYYVDKAPLKLFEKFRSVLQKRGIPAAQVKGSIDFDPVLDWSDPPFGDLAQLLRTYEAEMPEFRVLQVNARRFHSGSERTALELAYAVAKGSEYLAQMQKQGLSPALVNRHLQFSVDIGTIYFVEIAKIRALKQLWANVLQGYGVTDAPTTFLTAHLAPETQTEDPNTNMIRAATQAMSAAIGGVDILYVLPANASIEDQSTPFTRRIARNVQHILRMESYLDRVIDPGAGSYYIEKLTSLLAEKAWTKFQEIEAKGGYMEVG